MISSIDVSMLASLKGIFISNNLLTSLDISNNPDLETLFCSDNQISSLDFINNNGSVKNQAAILP